MNSAEQYDCVVIGGGPAGITAAMYMFRSGVRVALVEKLALGGQLLLTGQVENYPGFPNGITGYELAENFVLHMKHYAAKQYFGEVTAIERPLDVKEPIRLRIEDEWIAAFTVIICTGAAHRRLGLPKEEAMTGRGVSYCAICDANFFRAQEVGLVGGGNSALEEALFLANVVERVYLIHRRDKFRALKIYQDKVISHPKISIIYDSEVRELLGEKDLDGVRIVNVRSNESSTLDVKGLFIFVGIDPKGDFFPAGLKVDELGFVETDPDMRTSLPGVFAAGDIRSKNCRQLATSVGDGAVAATAAFSYLEKMNG